MKQKFIVTVFVILLALAGGIVLLGIVAPQFHTNVLHVANLLMAVLSLVAFSLVNKESSSRPQAMVTGVYSASLLRLMVCMVAILAYVLLNRHDLHKPTVLLLFAIYAIYTFAETRMASKTIRNKA